jgi:aspartate racemase
MKCLGLVGGPGVEATANYARQIDDETWHRYGNTQSANIVALSLQTKEFARQLAARDWPAVGRALTQATTQLTELGAEKVLLCSSVLHAAVDHLPKDAPLLHMADPTIAALRQARRKPVGLLGARTTEEEKMWRKRLAQAGLHGVLAPVARDSRHLATLLDEEFERGILNGPSRADTIRILFSLRHAGAKAVVVCAPALTAVLEDTVPVVPLFDAAELHALAAVAWMGQGLAARATA